MAPFVSEPFLSKDAMLFCLLSSSSKLIFQEFVLEREVVFNALAPS